MSRTWGRVSYIAMCGGCGASMKDNDPALFINFPNVKRALLRCEECAGHAPPDLPHNPPSRTTSAMVPIKKLASGLTVGPKIWKRG